MITKDGKWSDGSQFCCEICVFDKLTHIAIGAVYIQEISESELMEQFPNLLPGDEADVDTDKQEFISSYVEVNFNLFEYSVAYGSIKQDDDRNWWWKGDGLHPFKP